MKIDILTLFPNLFTGFINESIIKRAIDKGQVTINIHNIRDYSKQKNKKVDDYPFGGGAGMVLMCQPIFDAVAALKTNDSKIILTVPDGKILNQKIAHQLSFEKHLIIICGHYEGFDERIRTLADYEISIGKYILTGGELPSMVITDSVVRLLDGVINKDSLQNESFNNELMDYPNYTHPVDFNGMVVPEVLLSGHHQNILKYRNKQAIIKTNHFNEINRD